MHPRCKVFGAIKAFETGTLRLLQLHVSNHRGGGANPAQRKRGRDPLLLQGSCRGASLLPWPESRPGLTTGSDSSGPAYDGLAGGHYYCRHLRPAYGELPASLGPAYDGWQAGTACSSGRHTTVGRRILQASRAGTRRLAGGYCRLLSGTRLGRDISARDSPAATFRSRPVDRHAK